MRDIFTCWSFGASLLVCLIISYVMNYLNFFLLSVASQFKKYLELDSLPNNINSCYLYSQVCQLRIYVFLNLLVFRLDLQKKKYQRMDYSASSLATFHDRLLLKNRFLFHMPTMKTYNSQVLVQAKIIRQRERESIMIVSFSVIWRPHKFCTILTKV